MVDHLAVTKADLRVVVMVACLVDWKADPMVGYLVVLKAASWEYLLADLMAGLTADCSVDS